MRGIHHRTVGARGPVRALPDATPAVAAGAFVLHLGRTLGWVLTGTPDARDLTAIRAVRQASAGKRSCDNFIVVLWISLHIRACACAIAEHWRADLLLPALADAGLHQFQRH